MQGFVYPNEVEPYWSIIIVLYPYITGLVAGAFIVSALYHVFGINQLKSVARLSLLTALAFLMVAPLPLMLHLGHPERGVEIYWTPQPRSAMAGFGYIWLGYFLIVVAEVWLVFRPDIINYSKTSQGPKKLLYSVLTLGVQEQSERAKHIDEKLIKILATIGIPAAVFLHGYVGFIFGAIKANPWWSTPLMPFIFILSAIVSGMALLLLLYIITSKIRKKPVDHICVHTLAKWLFGFLVIALALEGLEIVSMAYESEESWGIISKLLTQKLQISYFVIQLGIGSLVPLIVLGGQQLTKMKDNLRTGVIAAVSALILIGVFAMRWNVVIGGQLFSKSLHGFTDYNLTFSGREGVGVAIVVLMLPFILFTVISYLIPPWKEAAVVEKKEVGRNFGWRR